MTCRPLRHYAVDVHGKSMETESILCHRLFGSDFFYILASYVLIWRLFALKSTPEDLWYY